MCGRLVHRLWSAKAMIRTPGAVEVAAVGVPGAVRTAKRRNERLRRLNYLCKTGLTEILVKLFLV